MIITIVGSMKFYREYLKLKDRLEKKKHKTILPLPDEFYEKSGKIKRSAMEDFNNNLKDSDAILVANYEKGGKDNYIGTNSIMEIGMAFNQKKKIFILKRFPENCKDELEAVEAIELNDDLSLIK